MKLVTAGDRAVLVELGEVDAADLHAAAVAVRTLPDVLACIAGHASLYVVTEGEPDLDAIGEALEPANGTDEMETETALHRLEVVFDGIDFEELLERTGLQREVLLERVRALRLTVRYIGFRGGFGYLDGWPEEWAMPRRPTSRPLVRRGTFAVAGSVAAFYPIDSPGGWNLLGRTASDLEHRLRPGDAIEIEPVDDLPAMAEPARTVERRATEVLEVISGPLTRLVDAADWASCDRGRSPGGPFDDLAAAIANRAAGNELGAPLFECAMAGPRVRALRDCIVAWCPPDLRVSVQKLRAGEERSFGRVEGGLRAYLAAGSGGGVPMHAERTGRTTIHAMAGPHAIEPQDIVCTVLPQMDRVGIRLRPERPLTIEAPASLHSIGMQCGTVQLHPDGSLVAMGPDHPVTGGYLQPMTVVAAERWKLAQLVPGETVTIVVR